MPLYEFECTKCSSVFEKLCENTDNLNEIKCPTCNEGTKKLLSRFSHTVSGGSSTDTVDVKIGREAEQRWSKFEERKSIRTKNMTDKGYKEMPVYGPKTPDGKHSPVMALGDDGEKSKRKEFSGALQEHKAELTKKGQTQFDGPGAF